MPTVKCRKCYEVFEVRADAEWVTCKSCDYHFHTDLRKQLRHSKKARKRRGSSGSTEIGALGLVVFVVVFFLAVLADFAAVTAVQSPNSDFKETAFGALFMVFAVPHAIVGAYAAACFTRSTVVEGGLGCVVLYLLGWVFLGIMCYFAAYS